MTYLTHTTHDLDYATPTQSCRPGVELAYDGLTVKVRA